MTTLIHCGADNHTGIILNQTGDLAVLFDAPSRSTDSPMPCNDSTLDWLDGLDLGDRLSGIFLVTRNKASKDKKIPLRDLRLGWQRVLGEITAITPNVKRVLVFCGSELINAVIFPELKGDHSTPGMEEFHGTIFTLPCGLEIVPTFNKQMAHTAPWMLADALRFRDLVKPPFPLSYRSNVIPRAAKWVAVDLETTGLHTWRDKILIMGLQWGYNERSIVDRSFGKAWDHLADLMLSGTVVWMHNKQFDIGFATQKFRDADAITGNCRCTLMRARAEGEVVGNLKHLGNLYSDRPGNYAWIEQGSQFTFNNPAYLCEDLAATWALVQHWQDVDTLVVKLMDECTLMGAEQTLLGSYIDLEALETAVDDARRDAKELYEKLFALYGVDPGKQELLCPVLIKMGYPVQKNKVTGKYILRAQELDRFGLFDVKLYRQLVKMDSSFVGKIKKLLRADGTLSHNQKMMAAETGRSTMSDFNWQQAGRKGPVRGLLISRFAGGVIWYIDLDTNEIRVGAYISGSEKMGRWALLSDGHRVTASRSLRKLESEVTTDERESTKTLLYRKMFMGQAYTELQKIIDEYLESEFSDFFGHMTAVGNLCMRTLFVTDAWGKTRRLEKTLAEKGKYAVKRAGGNSPIQGLASHFALWLTVRVWKKFKKLGMKSLVIMGIHDAIVGDLYPGEEELVIKCVQEAFKELGDIITKQFPVANWLPLAGELTWGKSWGEACSKGNPNPKFACSTLLGV